MVGYYHLKSQASKKAPWKTIGTWLGYSAPLSLALGHQEIEHLAEHAVAPRLQQREMTRKYVNGKGEARFTGGGDLKASQAYPELCLCFNVRLFGTFGVYPTIMYRLWNSLMLKNV